MLDRVPRAVKNRRTKIHCAIAACLLSVLIGDVHAHEIPRGDYLEYLPLDYPRLVQQVDASVALNLYGDRNDPAYRDVAPADGIDDRRGEVLKALAVRFAPYLVQNTTNFPVDFDAYIDNAASFPLYVDTWEIAGDGASIVDTSEINFSALGKPSGDAAAEDRKLVDLLDVFSPWAPRMEGIDQPFVRGRPDRFTVLFFDFPGEGPGSWERAYRPVYDKIPEGRRDGFPHAYVHPFIHDVVGDDGSHLGYDLVLQYWFFYPSNDGGNNHEGDWEHINVVVAPLSMVTQPLPPEVVERVLGGELSTVEDAADPLVIRRVEYYFHHYVMTLDFSSPNVYTPREEWKAEIKGHPQQRVRESDIWHAIRHLAYVDEDETVVNTHPLGYIGADNKGFDQALSAPGGKNRNSHGTFPFPGRYRHIGPASATEQISVSVDSRRYWKHLMNGKATTGPGFRRGSVLGLADPRRLTIVPDWERVVDLARNDADVRRHWSWLLLPIQWGYPATESPFSGVVPHADTGNASPVGPSFSTGWNVSGAAPGFHTYEPHTLASVFPLGLQDNFRNDLGFLNFTLPVLATLPPLNFVSSIGTYPLKLAFGRRDPVYYPKELVPFRFFALSSGVSVQVVDQNFSLLLVNPSQMEELFESALRHLILNGVDSTTVSVGQQERMQNSVQAFYQAQFYIGRHFTSENTIRNVRSTYNASVAFSNIPSYRYSADLNYWEYAGSLRYSLTAKSLQPFVKAGYGWSWYRWQNVQSNGVRFDPAESGWIQPRHLWPNVWHLGVGFEFVPWKRVGAFPQGVEVAFRAEYARYFEKFGLDLSAVPTSRLSLFFPTLGDIPTNQLVVRDAFDFGMSVSF